MSRGVNEPFTPRFQAIFKLPPYPVETVATDRASNARGECPDQGQP